MVTHRGPDLPGHPLNIDDCLSCAPVPGGSPPPDPASDNDTAYTYNLRGDRHRDIRENPTPVT